MIGSGEAAPLSTMQEHYDPRCAVQYPPSINQSINLGPCPGQFDAELPPFTPSARRQHLLRDCLLQSLAISLPKIMLDLFQMLRLPVKSYQPRYQQLRPFLPRARLVESLVEEEGVAHGPVDDPVEDMRQCFALLG